MNKRQDEYIAKLWQAAHDYEYAQISGSAIGLVTIGVIQNKPKSIQVSRWQKSIWALYYQRKETIKSGLFNHTLLDFSSCGPIPHTMPEIMEEVLVEEFNI